MKPAPPVTRITPLPPYQREPHREAAAALLVADADLAAVGFDHAPGDGQAQAGAAPVPGRAGGLAPEGDVEDPVEVDLGDAPAGVEDGDVGVGAGHPGFDHDGPVGGCVADGVLQ